MPQNPLTNRSPPGQRSTTVAHTHERVMGVMGFLQQLSTLAAGGASDTGIPGLGAALSTIAKVLEKLQTMQTTVKGVDTLLERVNTLLDQISGYYSRPHDQQLPESMQKRIDVLVSKWLDIADRAQRVKSGSIAKRFFKSDGDAKMLEGFVDEISTSIQVDFLLGGVLDIEENLHRVGRRVETVQTSLTTISKDVGLANDNIQKIKQNLDPSFMPRYAKNARYDANGVRRRCIDGTRTGVLDRLRAWVTIACTYHGDIPGGGVVYWINGLGGTGKTTVAYSLSESFETEGKLAGNFFCSRSDAECSDPNMIFVTLSRQLCDFHGPFKEKVEEVLRGNSNITYSGPEQQFKELILSPLEALKDVFPRSVVVLDALDECGGTATSIILSVIGKFVHRIARFLVFIVTSRPEERITALFEESRVDSLKNSTTSLILHEISLDSVTSDIRLCLDYDFHQQVGRLGVTEDWPSAEEKDKLAELAHGLFIWVATAVPFIMDEAYCDPKGQLRLLFGDQPDSEDSKTFLDVLYTTIMVASAKKVTSTLAKRLREVVGTIAVAQEPLSVSALANLVGLDEQSVRNTLVGLHSLLHIPRDSHQPIHIIHPTFPEFLLQSPGMALTPAYHVQRGPQNWFMFSRCLEVMSFLKRDMVNIRYPAKFKSEIPGFSDLARKAIPSHVRYACRYWTHHLRDGITDPTEIDMFGRLHGFVHEEILFWLEACIVLEIPAARALEVVLKACRTLGNAFADLVPILTDCHRFIQTYSSVMHTAPLQLYHFALSIAPTGSDIRGLHSHELKYSVVVREGAPSRWAPSLDTFVGHHGKAIYSVAFSSNGSCFASGGEDNHVRIRDSASRTEVQSFDGRRRAVNCVAFSPDGAHVASGSDDGTACIWQVSSGARVHTLEGHTDDVCSVAYSADGRRLLSATDEGEVKLWDTADGRCVFALEKTENRTWQAALSPNGDVIARGEGTSLVLRDVSSATHKALKLPDKVEACTFSPDGRYVAARTWHAIRVWATADKALVRSIDMADSTLKSRLAFSRDGKYIACGSKSGAVYMWEVTSQESPHTLNGHTTQVDDVAWSPDGLQLASAAQDGTIRLWDGALHSIVPETPAASAHQPAPPGPPRFALLQYQGSATLLHLTSLGIDDFPPNPRLPEGAPTVTIFTDVVAACDATLQSDDQLSSSSDRARNWAFLTGQQHTKLGRRPVAISRDGSRLAYLSPTSDKVVDVCDLRSGIMVATLKGHTKDVRSIVFSPDDTRLATGSKDGAVKVWDATTGALICGHAEHRDWVRATAFSSDSRFVASCSDDETVRVFDVAAERVEHVLGSHNHWVMESMFTVADDHIVALDDSDQVVIWEVATGSQIHSFSFHTHDWPRSLTFSSNTVGIHIHSDAEERTIGVWKTSTRPITFTEVDGWVYAMLPGVTHRLCWLPPEWRTIMRSDGGTLCLKEARSDAHPRGRVIAIDMSRIIAYIDNLPPDSL